MTHHSTLANGQPLHLQLLSPPTFWRCEPSWSWVSPPLPNYLLWCVLDGIGHLQLDNRSTELGPGTCAVFAPGDAPTASHDPRRRLLVFGMHFQLYPQPQPQGDQGELAKPGDEDSARGDGDARLDREERGDREEWGDREERLGPADRGAQDGRGVVPEVRWGEVADRVLLGALARGSDSAYRRGDRLGERQAELCLEQVLCLIWEAAYGTRASSVDTAIEEVAQVIRQDPGRDWSVREMAARASLSRAQFTRRFVAQNGMAPAQYLIKARIDRAHQLLTETGMTVTQVAGALGYADVPYFSRQYKQRTGRSPSAARPRSTGNRSEDNRPATS